jgi:hypothetical protein
MRNTHQLSRTFALLLVAASSLSMPRIAAAQAPTTEVWYVMDREAYSRTDDTRLVRTTYDLRNGPNLKDFPMELGEWVGQELPITNLETFPTLDAEQIVYRGYVRDSDGGMIILSFVSGTKGQSFHHPLVCYEWAAWPTEDLGTTVLPMGANDVVLREVAGIDPNGPRQIDLSFYLWPNDQRTWDLGATQVRVTGVAYDGDEKALAWARDFASLLFADVRRPDAPASVAPAAPPAEAPPAPEMVPAPTENPLIPLPGEPPLAPEEAPAEPGA